MVIGAVNVSCVESARVRFTRMVTEGLLEQAVLPAEEERDEARETDRVDEGAHSLEEQACISVPFCV
jgi:hypothetical protein